MAKHDYSESDQEALKTQRLLGTMMEQVLQQNEDIRRRLSQLEARSDGFAPSMRFLEDDSITIRQPRRSVDETRSIIPTTNTVNSDANVGLYTTMTFQREFEIVLKTSRVYRRVELNECDMSMASSAVRTHAWSLLSGISLAEISNISVIGLPLSFQEFTRLLSLSSGVDISISDAPVLLNLNGNEGRIINRGLEAESSTEDTSKPQGQRLKHPPVPIGKMKLHKIAVLGDGKVSTSIEYEVSSQ
jgi:hypothetical protein